MMTNGPFKLEKKKQEYEFLREQRKRFQAEMDLLDLQTRREETEMDRLTNDLSIQNLSGGHQSEPTTPPEFRESNNGFPTPLSRPNRFSASMLSPPGLQSSLSTHSNRTSRNTSQVASPRYYHGHSHSQSISHIPSKSVPGSRRGSDEEEETYDFDLPPVNKKSGARYVFYLYKPQIQSLLAR